MPIYEYKCHDCDKTFEILQKVSDPPLSACIHCSGKVSKVISPSGLVFKGSGWYITDYSSKKKETKESSSAETKTSAPAEQATGNKKTPAKTNNS